MLVPMLVLVLVERAGQSVTVEAQEMTVDKWVIVTVLSVEASRS